MIDYVSHYQFGFFAPGARVEPLPDNISRLLFVLQDKGFIPTTTQEIQIGPITQQRLQLQMITMQSEWVLAFEPHRVVLTKRNVPQIEIGRAESFIEEVVETFSRLWREIPLTGTRLSYVTKGLLHTMSPENLTRVNSQLFNLPAFYSEHPPIEWTSRNVARYETYIGDKLEIINVITDINRVTGTIPLRTGLQAGNRIEIGFDINTFQGNTIPRFGLDDVGLFLKTAVELSQQILSELEERING
jgi:hypothetical protein